MCPSALYTVVPLGLLLAPSPLHGHLPLAEIGRDQTDSILEGFFAGLPLALLLALPIVYFSSFLHELGHAVMGRLLGAQVSAFGMGIGRVFFCWTCWGSKIYLGTRNPFQGLTLVLFPDLHPPRGQLVGFLLGGILVHLLLTLLGLAFWWLLPAAGPLWLNLVGWNALLGVANAVPFSVRVGTARLRSDGAGVLFILRTGGIGMSGVERLAFYGALTPLLRELDDRTTLQAYLLGAVGIWQDLGAFDHAESLCQKAMELCEPPPVHRGLEELNRGLIACGAGRLDEGSRWLARAEQTFQALHHEAGLWCIQLSQTEYHYLNGDASAALSKLQTLREHPLTASQLELRVELLVAELTIRSALPADPGLAVLEAEYLEVRGHCPSSIRDLRVYRALGRWHAARADWPAAATSYRTALAAVREIHAGLIQKDDRERFLGLQREGWSAEMKHALSRAGQADEADAVDGLFTSGSMAKPDPGSEQHHGHRRLALWAGLTSSHLLLGLVCLAATAWILSTSDTTPTADWFIALLFLDFCLLLSLMLNVLCLLLRVILGFVFPSIRNQDRMFLLLFGLLPWLLWLACLIACLFSGVRPD